MGLMADAVEVVGGGRGGVGAGTVAEDSGGWGWVGVTGEETGVVTVEGWEVAMEVGERETAGRERGEVDLEGAGGRG